MDLTNVFRISHIDPTKRYAPCNSSLLENEATVYHLIDDDCMIGEVDTSGVLTLKGRLDDFYSVEELLTGDDELLRIYGEKLVSVLKEG